MSANVIPFIAMIIMLVYLYTSLLNQIVENFSEVESSVIVFTLTLVSIIPWVNVIAIFGFIVYGISTRAVSRKFK